MLVTRILDAVSEIRVFALSERLIVLRAERPLWAEWVRGLSPERESEELPGGNARGVCGGLGAGVGVIDADSNFVVIGEDSFHQGGEHLVDLEGLVEGGSIEVCVTQVFESLCLERS